MLRVLVVDDSSFVRKAVRRMLDTTSDIRVVADAADGAGALDAVVRMRIDVVTLDVQLPDISGLAVLKQLRALRPDLPVLMLSARTQIGTAVTVEALTLGAADFIDKTRFGSIDIALLGAEIAEKIRAVVQYPARAVAAPVPVRQDTAFDHCLDKVTLCTIGSSTGGPAAVQAVLEAAHADLHFPIVVAQHMPAGFTKLFAERLNTLSRLRVTELVQGELLKAGCAYIVPGERHARIEAGLTASLFTDPTIGAHVPSVDALFSSAARVSGSGVLGVLLTGMGRDGARGLLEIHQAAGCTVGQDESTSIVYGMPRAAKELGAVQEELALPRICDLFRAPNRDRRPRS